MRRIVWALLIVSLLPTVAFSREKEKKIEPCALLSADDAASIVGAPMKIVDLSKSTCAYGEYRGRGSFVRGGVLDRALFFYVKRYKDSQAQDKDWTKDAQSALEAANKNQTKAVSGIGDQAYLVGSIEEAETMDNAGIRVRKGAVYFSIQIMLVPGHQPVKPSADALIAVAKKIADQL